MPRWIPRTKNRVVDFVQHTPARRSRSSNGHSNGYSSGNGTAVLDSPDVDIVVDAPKKRGRPKKTVAAFAPAMAPEVEHEEEMAHAPAMSPAKGKGKGKGKAKADAPMHIEMRPLAIREFMIPIQGTAPLIVHKFSEKQKKQIEDKQQQKAKGGREARDPHSEYLAALYVMPGTGPAGSKGAKYGVPAAGFKKAAVKSCRYIDGMNMTFASGAFHVLEDAGGLVQIKYKTLRMREDTVRLSGPSRALDLRYRPEFTEWSCVLRIRYNMSAISAEQIVNLFHHAGFHIGWGELRAEKGYSNGTWIVPEGKSK